MVSLEALRGYVLEEAVAKMLAACGYRLLTREADDPAALRSGRNGLLVRGRGSNHQADALGELAIPMPFSLPTRLFVEAKFRGNKTGLDTVRNALGVLSDVNEYYRHTDATRSLPPKRYQYRYSLFSTSGFTTNAQSFALAQQISLIDLSGPAFDDVRRVVADAADRFFALAQKLESGVKVPTRQVRGALRRALGTLDEDELADVDGGPKSTHAKRSAPSDPTIESGDEHPVLPDEQAQEIAEQLADDLDAVFVLAFPDAPFVIALLPYDIGLFDAFLDGGSGTRRVRIRFDRDGNERWDTGEWVISSDDVPDVPIAYFGLPPILEAWLLAANENQREAKRRLTEDVLSTLTVYRRGQAIQLRYEPLMRPTERIEGYAEGRAPLRRRYPSQMKAKNYWTIQLPEGAPDIRDVYANFTDSPRWTSDSLAELLARLDQQRPIQARVLRRAAEGNGLISRDDVYQIAEYDNSRSLRGFTRPIRRISDSLVGEGLLEEGAPYPLAAWYPAPGPATWFTMPAYVARLLSDIGSGAE